MLKKCFFCLKCLDCVNHQEKLIFFKNKFKGDVCVCVCVCVCGWVGVADVSDFSSHKNGEIGKIGEVVLKRSGITYFHTNLPFPVLPFSECLVCVSVCLFCLFTPFLSLLFVFHRKNLVLQHLINKYVTSVNLSLYYIKYTSRSFQLKIEGKG